MRGLALLLESSYCRSDHWIAPVRRDHRRSLGKPPAWSRVTYKVRPGCSGLFPVRALPSLNLSNFSVVKSIASCLPPSTPGGLSFSPPQHLLFSRLSKPSSLSLTSEHVLWSLAITVTIQWTCSLSSLYLSGEWGRQSIKLQENTHLYLFCALEL